MENGGREEGLDKTGGEVDRVREEGNRVVGPNQNFWLGICNYVIMMYQN